MNGELLLLFVSSILTICHACSSSSKESELETATNMSTSTRCLKITEKVSFNIASEAWEKLKKSNETFWMIFKRHAVF